ncbi:radical SAM protein [Deferrisoma sp.]
MRTTTIEQFVVDVLLGGDPDGRLASEDETRVAAQKIRCRYGVEVEDLLCSGQETLTSVRLDQVIREGIRRRMLSQVDAKSVFEGFVFRGRCKRLVSPFEINIDITFRCNHRCIFCYASAKDCTLPADDEMPTQDVLDIIDQFAELGGGLVLYGGGEPFLREDFLDILSHTKSRGLWTYIISNGSLITPEVAREYAKLYDPRFDRIQISLDGSCPEIHDRQRGHRGAFELTTQGIRNLTATGKIRPIINTVLTRLNWRDVPNLLNLAIEYGAMTYRCLKLHKIGRGQLSDRYDQLALSAEEGEIVFRFLERKREELLGVIGIASDNACVFPMSVGALRAQIEYRPGEEPASYSCAAGTTKLAVSPSGSVVPCSYFYDYPEFIVGSLREMSLKELWEDEARWAAFREPLVPEGKCAQCGYLHACKTGCRIMSYVGSGSFGSPDIGCTFEPNEQRPVCSGA